MDLQSVTAGVRGLDNDEVVRSFGGLPGDVGLLALNTQVLLNKLARNSGFERQTWVKAGELIAKSARAPWMAGAIKRATVRNVENMSVVVGWEGGRKKKGGGSWKLAGTRTG